MEIVLENEKKDFYNNISSNFFLEILGEQKRL